MFKNFWHVELFGTGYKFNGPMLKNYFPDQNSKLYRDDKNNILKPIKANFTIAAENLSINSTCTILKPWITVSRKEWIRTVERIRNGV